MKSFSLVALGVIAFGALTLSGCSGCAPAEEETETGTTAPSVTCGAGTRRVGNQCVGTNVSSSNSGGNTLNTTGNN